MSNRFRGRSANARGRRLMRCVADCCPRDADQLHALVMRLLEMHIPRQPIIPGNDAPFDYLTHTFFEGQGASADCIVWANRGGGKTFLGAAATLLDLLFKPGIQVRILGGSLEQSSKMYAHLRQMCERQTVRPLLAAPPTQRRIQLINGSTAELLAQSQRSVRGQRVHKLRCDEVEEFKDDIWQAAQLITRGGTCGHATVQGSIEALSTAHRPHGLMMRLIDQAQQHGQPRLFRWNAMDVIERCPTHRDCQTCQLWNDCGGRAKQADGFVRIDDLIAQYKRSSNDTWASELMCQKPKRSDCVFPAFNTDQHVAPVTVNGENIIGGMDFGLRSPLVMLWAQVRSRGDEQIVEVFDEYVQRERTLERHLDAIVQRGWPQLQWVGVDPAGRQRNSHTGTSDIALLRRRGLAVRSRASAIHDGIERIRRRLDRGTLFIDPRCTQLIEAMSLYHFDTSNPTSETPVKDGPDHLCDALRYMILNLEAGDHTLKQRVY